MSEKLYRTCRYCGRKLKSEESQLIGFGPICYKRYKLAKVRKRKLILFEENDDKGSGGTCTR